MIARYQFNRPGSVDKVQVGAENQHEPGNEIENSTQNDG